MDSRHGNRIETAFVISYKHHTHSICRYGTPRAQPGTLAFEMNGRKKSVMEKI